MLASLMLCFLVPVKCEVEQQRVLWKQLLYFVWFLLEDKVLCSQTERHYFITFL